MSKTILIIEIVLLILLITICIESYIYFKKNENKLIEDIRKKLLLRINIIRILTILIAVIGIINILINSI